MMRKKKNFATPLQNPTDQNQNDTNFLHDIESEFNEDEKLWGKLKDDLAKIVNRRFNAKLWDEMLAKRFDAHNRPQNCPELVVPSVNEDIWGQLPPAASKLAQIQRAVVESATAIWRVANEHLDSASAHGERVKHCTDSIAMLGQASREMSLHRRTAVRPYVNKSLSRICEAGVPFTDKLFGDDLPATLKDIKEMDKLGTSLSPNEKRRGTLHSQYDSGEKNTFLALGSRYQQRPHVRGMPAQRRPFRGRKSQGQQSSLSYSL